VDSDDDDAFQDDDVVVEVVVVVDEDQVVSRSQQRVVSLLYLDRIAVVEMGAVEAAAGKAWERAEALFKRKSMKGAKAAYESFMKQHGQTKTAAAKAKDLKERLEVIENVIGPAQGLARLPVAFRKGLVLFYDFNRDEGERVRDQSGNGNHGKVEGAKWVANARGARDGAFAFAGKGSLVVLPNATLGNGDQLTYSVWVKAPRYSGKSWPAFIGGYVGSPGKNLCIGISQDKGSLHAEVETDKGNYAIHGGGEPIPWDTWFHAVMVYDGSTLTEYINGKKGRSMSAGGNLKTPDLLTLGTDHRTVYAALTGLLDDVMIFRRAFSEAEVKQLYGITGKR